MFIMGRRAENGEVLWLFFSVGIYNRMIKKRLLLFLKMIIMYIFLSFRLTADVQDFKSSFKQVISQGLKSCTQVREEKHVYPSVKCISTFPLSEWNLNSFSIV